MDAVTAVKGTIVLMALLLIPGIAISYAIFPRKQDLDVLERLGYSFILGLTPPLILYFLSKTFEVPANPTTTTATFIFVTIAALAIWKMRPTKSAAAN
ncbi:Uncharacterised protein [uncultured archaeon]|nr:Uncharacterised protein [uncultured archaeon]